MISLIMATYNGGKYLREQLNSIYKQTLVPDEIIVVDDCSQDNTIEILTEYKDKYDLEFYINETNLGVNRTFERALTLAKGKYICICDQDDVWFPTKIEKTYKKLIEIENGKPSCVSSMKLDTDELLNSIDNYAYCHKDSTWETPLFSYGSQGCTLMFNIELKRIILPFCHYCIYDAFIGELACFVGNRYFIGEPLMFYRHHTNNVVANKTYKNHRYMSEAVKVYQLIRMRSRLYLYKFFRREYSEYIDQEHMILLNKIIDYYDSPNDFTMIRNVLQNKYFDIRVKFSFVLFTCLTWISKKRQVCPKLNPFN